MYSRNRKETLQSGTRVLTQILSGHGFFGCNPDRMGKTKTDVCNSGNVDDMEFIS